jgi:hypothetical protein
MTEVAPPPAAAPPRRAAVRSPRPLVIRVVLTKATPTTNGRADAASTTY